MFEWVANAPLHLLNSIIFDMTCNTFLRRKRIDCTVHLLYSCHDQQVVKMLARKIKGKNVEIINVHSQYVPIVLSGKNITLLWALCNKDTYACQGPSNFSLNQYWGSVSIFPSFCKAISFLMIFGGVKVKQFS